MRDHKKTNHLLLWIVMIILITLGLGLFIWQYFSSDKSTIAHLNTAPAASTVQPSSNVEQNLSTKTTVSEAEEQNEVSTPQTLVNSDLNHQVTPNNPVLQQEEIDKLKDIQKQLKNQQKNLNEQHQNVDKLIELKQAQVELLEQQLKQQ